MPASLDWSALHHGIDPEQVPLLSAYLRVVGALARPVRAVPPLVFTVAGAVLAIAAVALAGVEPWLALAAVVAATACDALDGAVAVLAQRASAFGALADRVADRLADCAFALVIWRCGAPLWLAVLAGAVSLAHETVRELRRGALLTRITVAERPSRVICTALACGSAGVSAATWPATVCAAVWLGLAVIGFGQLVRA